MEAGLDHVEKLKRSVEVCMFDQYGTVVDMQSGLMRTAFIDRRQRPFGMTPHQPDIIVRSMTKIADLMV
jgi:hypothetical protein